MDVKELAHIMVEYGVALRALPKETIELYEKNHLGKYPDGEVKYIEAFKREMVVVKRIEEKAGKFVLESDLDRCSIVKFRGKKFYDTIEEAIADLLLTKQ